MQIKWYGHACFLISGDGVRIITDPYTPAVAGLKPVNEPVDIVIMSSATDRFHSDAKSVPGNPQVINALEVARSGGTTEVRGIRFNAIESQESLIHKQDPDDNAMYTFTVGGVRIGHFGDMGNPLTPEQLDFFRNVDVLLVLTGGPPTIELDDLDTVIKEVQPKMVIPMHYKIPNLRLNILGLEAFTQRYPAEMVVMHPGTTIDVTPDSLPKQTTIVVLEAEANK